MLVLVRTSVKILVGSFTPDPLFDLHSTRVGFGVRAVH